MGIKDMKAFFKELIEKEGFGDFFQISSRISKPRTIDILLRRYNDINYILKMPIKEAMEQIKIAVEEEQKELLYRQWLMYLPNMNKETYMGFAEFYKESQPKEIDTRKNRRYYGRIIGRISFGTF